MEKQNLPNATPVLILGILSIVTCCCYGFGLILGIVALVLAKKDIALYKQSPEIYLNYSNLKTGRILAIVGIILSVLMLLFVIYVYVVMGEAGLLEMQQRMLERAQAEQQQ
jgi:hypothetical protein